MPKTRSIAHVQTEFEVSSWSTKPKDSTALPRPDTVVSVEFADLIFNTAVRPPATIPSTAPITPPPTGAADRCLKRPAPDPGAGSWITKQATAPSHQQGQETSSTVLGHAPADVGPTPVITTLDYQAEAQPEQLEQGAQDTGHEDPIHRATSCSGACHLAFLPNGKVAGHIVDVSTRQCYGVTGKRAAMKTTGCMYDDDVEVYTLKLINFETLDEAEAAVSKSGGDLARFQPAEAWQMTKHLNLTAEEVEEWGVRVEFQAHQLYDGIEAEQQLSKFAPSLTGLGALVNAGQALVTGLPAWFF